MTDWSIDAGRKCPRRSRAGRRPKPPPTERNRTQSNATERSGFAHSAPSSPACAAHTPGLALAPRSERAHIARQPQALTRLHTPPPRRPVHAHLPLPPRAAPHGGERTECSARQEARGRSASTRPSLSIGPSQTDPPRPHRRTPRALTEGPPAPSQTDPQRPHRRTPPRAFMFSL